MTHWLLDFVSTIDDPKIDAITCTRHVWSNGAMGFPDEWATQALVPGWIVELTSGEERERWHVSDQGVARKWEDA